MGGLSADTDYLPVPCPVGPPVESLSGSLPARSTETSGRGSLSLVQIHQ